MLDAAYYAAGRPDLAEHPPAEHAPRLAWAAPVPLEVALAAKTGPASSAVRAHLNHGRWIVECPDCHDAQFASSDDPRFMCVSCANTTVGGAFRPVTWPKNRDDIEELLGLRPPENQNWIPGETAKQLHAENEWFMKGGR